MARMLKCIYVDSTDEAAVIDTILRQAKALRCKTLDWDRTWDFTAEDDVPPRGYIQVWVVVSGIELESKEFPYACDPDDDSALVPGFDTWLEEWRQTAEASQEPTAIYVIQHNHPPVDECACVQYLTDHHPAYTWNED